MHFYHNGHCRIWRLFPQDFARQDDRDYCGCEWDHINLIAHCIFECLSDDADELIKISLDINTLRATKKAARVGYISNDIDNENDSVFIKSGARVLVKNKVNIHKAEI